MRRDVSIAAPRKLALQISHHQNKERGKGKKKKALWRVLTWRYNIHMLPNSHDGWKPRQAMVSSLLVPKPKSFFPSKPPAVHAFCFLFGRRILFSHLSQSIIWPFCCWLPTREPPLLPNAASCLLKGASAEVQVVDGLARSLWEKKLNQVQNKICRSCSPHFPPAVISRLTLQPSSLISSSFWRLWVL